MKKQDIQHIFFDLDNTLWDHRGNSEHALGQMYQERNLTSTTGIDFETWHTYFYDHNEMLWAKIRDGEINKQDLKAQRFPGAFAHFGINGEGALHDFEEEYIQRMGKMTGVVKNAQQLLDYLSPKYKIHILTNGFQEISHFKVENSVLNGYFETLSSADEIGVRKPAKKLYDHALQKANALPQNSIMIGDDWLADIVGATAIGMQAIFFNPLNEKHQMDDVPTVYDLAEIMEIL